MKGLCKKLIPLLLCLSLASPATAMDRKPITGADYSMETAWKCKRTLQDLRTDLPDLERTLMLDEKSGKIIVTVRSHEETARVEHADPWGFVSFLTSTGATLTGAPGLVAYFAAGSEEPLVKVLLISAAWLTSAAIASKRVYSKRMGKDGDALNRLRRQSWTDAQVLLFNAKYNMDLKPILRKIFSERHEVPLFIVARNISPILLAGIIRAATPSVISVKLGSEAQ